MKIAITTPTGKVGRKLVNLLLDDGNHELILLARSVEKLADETARGAKVMQGNQQDADYVKEATRGVDVLFWVIPPNPRTDNVEGYYREMGKIGTEAIRENNIPRAVLLSSIGAQLGKGVGPVNGFNEVEKMFREATENLVILRPTYFMDNLLMSLENIRTADNVYLPVDGGAKIPMIATEDIARVAADILAGPFTGTRVMPLHGPKDYSFSEVADMIGQAIGKNVAHVKVDPKQTRQALTDMGLSEHMAAMMVELHEAIDEGRLKGEHPRTEQTTTPTRFEEFAQRTIKPAVQE